MHSVTICDTGAYLFTNSLSAIFALDRMLDDIVFRYPAVGHGQCIQGKTNPKKIEDFIDEGSVHVVSAT